MVDEKTPLLRDIARNEHEKGNEKTRNSWHTALSNSIIGTVRVVISAALAPGYFVVACFYDDRGHFSLTMPFIRIGRRLSHKQKRRKKKQTGGAMSSTSGEEVKQDTSTSVDQRYMPEIQLPATNHQRMSSSSSLSTASSVSSLDSDATDESNSRRSIRIKAINEDALRKRKQRKAEDTSGRERASIGSLQTQLTIDTIKSPTSTSAPSHLTKWPRAPAPPRPLIPKRLPSYATASISNANVGKKTLIIDLDETLIHSMAKGGRMSTGHMVEVKLSNPVGVGGAVIGPQVPILYYVHKRPHCDEFLKKVSKWYNLICFTASVQEYADPVIDWLELERKYFSKRYYRQDCTFRNGAYIKDLSHVEADLSRVMILDNSPMSYIFHEDNAIPIEGWISDPTDNDLLHLIPLLEGLQHTTDVRALLSLRLGEASAAS